MKDKLKQIMDEAMTQIDSSDKLEIFGKEGRADINP